MGSGKFGQHGAFSARRRFLVDRALARHDELRPARALGVLEQRDVRVGARSDAGDAGEAKGVRSRHVAAPRYRVLLEERDHARVAQRLDAELVRVLGSGAWR